jgi:hypothetical protein
MNRRHIFVRPIRSEDAKTFVEWCRDTKNNLFDPEVVKYPSTTVRVAYNSEGPVVFVPVQRPLMLEALAISPKASELDVATGLKALTQDAVAQAHICGAGEIYFLCRDELTSKFAERHGYEKINVQLYRIKLTELEKPEDPKRS